MKKYKPDETNILNGIAAAPGISIYRAFLYKKEKETVNKTRIKDVEEAIQNLEEALEQSRKELKKVLGLAIDKLGEKRAAIFEAQIMILDDPILLKNIRERIKKEKLNPEYIVDDEISKYQAIMASAHESYMRERSHDIEDIKHRIIKNLKKKKWRSRISEDVIVVVDNLTPADTVLFSRSNVKGYVTDFGGLTSHAAIVARSLNIPSVVGLHDGTEKIKQDDLLIVDGFRGKVVINPIEKQLSFYKKKITEMEHYDSELLKLKNLPATTTDGRTINILANLDLSEEIEIVIQNGGKGVGLVRTEQLFEEYEDFPDEEEQLKIYKNLAEEMYPEKVIIRALDVGGDKVLPVDVKEPNPFLGWRGIRFLIDNCDLFKTQIRAILRSSCNKNVGLMIPMVSSIAEIRKFKKIVAECKEELKTQGCEFDNHIPLGIMIEVPSAAVLAREFAEEVTFISIGTNDLIQYLLAVDRGNEIVSPLYQEFHPAVIKTLDHIIRHSKLAKARVHMCGEMAADTVATSLLVGLGLDAFSVSPSVIPRLKKIIRSISYEDAKKLASECLEMRTELEIKTRVIQFNDEKLKKEELRLF
ncbi:MAG: phosphoenolpyruvate--protein phosphotransferase [Ignavibacteria bacterium]|nr:phosphoenolpyruvate--protein phosphotransferase [Ignavibacteria bacterium]